jgi:hypothetical protein
MDSVSTGSNARKRRVELTGRVRVVEMTGPWGVYQGERIIVGDGRSFQDDLGIRLRGSRTRR